MCAILGTIQASYTDFKYVRKVWKDNAEEERLLGISMTGIMDHHVMSGIRDRQDESDELTLWLREFRQIAKEANELWATKLGINPAKQLTLVKPSGTVSSLCGTSSGIHPRYAPYYIRRATQDHKDPLTQLMKDAGIPYTEDSRKVYFQFPTKSPEGAIVRKDMGPLDQLELWKIYSESWCDGNPSQTIYYDDSSFLDVQAWVYRNWDMVGGLSFFPSDNNVYSNMPFEEISKEKYEQMVREFPTQIDWEGLSQYEKDDDAITSSQELACSGGGGCEI